MKRNPYIGPKPFEEKDRELYFGREAESSALLSLVLSHRLVLFSATSGAGKSSLINAALVPALERENFKPLKGSFRGGINEDTIQQEENIFIFNLLTTLNPNLPTEKLRSLSLADYLKTYHPLERSENPFLPQPATILIIDQFEDLFSRFETHWQQREGVFREIANAMSRDAYLWVLLAVRDDYEIQLNRFAHLVPGQLRIRYHMERMRAEAALDAVQEPAAKGRRPFEPGTAEEIVHDLSLMRTIGQKTQVPGEYIEPVQLQIVCYELWEQLRSTPGETITNEDVRQFANVDESLGDYYNRVVKAISNTTEVSEFELREWFDTQLITEMDTRGLVFRGDSSTQGLSNIILDQVLKDSFLLRSSSVGGGIWYELIHDRFIPAIQRANKEAGLREKSNIIRQQQNLRRYSEIGLIVFLLFAFFSIITISFLNNNLEVAQNAQATAGAAEITANAAATSNYELADSYATAFEALTINEDELVLTPIPAKTSTTATSSSTPANSQENLTPSPELEVDETMTITATAGVEMDETMTVTATAGVLEKQSKIDGMRQLIVPEGEFTMGRSNQSAEIAFDRCGTPTNCDRSWFFSAVPEHVVYLDTFWIDETEISNNMYSKCVDAGVCTAPAVNYLFYREVDSYYDNPEFADFPVVYVSWADADIYCKWAGRRLPTEAEWEKAARGIDQRIYPWGDEFIELNVNSCERGRCELDSNTPIDGYRLTAPVSSMELGRSPFDALHMSGNVAEWVNDWYLENYYEFSPATNPSGPNRPDSGLKAYRGGSWFNESLSGGLMTTFRQGLLPGNRIASLGFRCAESAE